MKTIRVHRHGEPEVMRIEELPDPRPDAGQVVVEIRAAGVNPVDTYLRAGTQGYTAMMPYTPGLDGAGVVVEVGEGVSGVSAGDRVYCAGAMSGTYTDKALCLESQVYPLPAQISFPQGASVYVPYTTAYQALHERARVQPGDVVLVHGASGGVGIAAVQLARAFGLEVIGTAGTEASRRLVGEQGAHYVLDHHSPDHLREAVELTHGRGVDIILEMLANVNLGKDLPALATGGRVVVVGSRGDVQITPRDLMGRDAAILGMSLINLPAGGNLRIQSAIRAGLENGTLRPVVGEEMPLEEAPRAHRAVIDSPRAGRIALIP